MTVEELVRRLSVFPKEMQVKVSALIVEDIESVVQDGEEFVKIILKGGK